MKKVNLKGMSFGFLTVLNESVIKTYKRGNTVIQWLCKCICGNEIITSSALLLRKKYPKISCGCKNFTQKHANTKLANPQLASYRSLIKRYRSSARNKSKNVSWELIEKQAIALFCGNCFYCNSEPTNTYNVYLTKAGKYSTKNLEHADKALILFNGIDRKNSSLGYTNDNTVSCCTICNFAKNELPVDKFYEWINRLALNQGYKNENSSNIRYP